MSDGDGGGVGGDRCLPQEDQPVENCVQPLKASCGNWGSHILSSVGKKGVFKKYYEYTFHLVKNKKLCIYINVKGKSFATLTNYLSTIFVAINKQLLATFAGSFLEVRNFAGIKF